MNAAPERSGKHHHDSQSGDGQPESTPRDSVAYAWLSGAAVLALGFYLLAWHRPILNNSVFEGNTQVSWLAAHVLFYLIGYALLCAAIVLAGVFALGGNATRGRWLEVALLVIAALLAAGAYSGVRFMNSGVWAPTSGPFRYRWYSDLKLFTGVFTASLAMVGSILAWSALLMKRPLRRSVVTGVILTLATLSFTLFFFYPRTPHPDGLANARSVIQLLIRR